MQNDKTGDIRKRRLHAESGVQLFNSLIDETKLGQLDI